MRPLFQTQNSQLLSPIVVPRQWCPTQLSGLLGTVCRVGERLMRAAKDGQAAGNALITIPLNGPPGLGKSALAQFIHFPDR